MVKSLIEQWFPAAAVGAESLRERGSAKAFPPINFLHVWWARRPLTTCRAALLASLLPAWPSDSEIASDEPLKDVRKQLERNFPDGESQYQAWFMRIIGIMGDPVKGRAYIKNAHAIGAKFSGNGYGYVRAFTVNPDADTLGRVSKLVEGAGHTQRPTILDPFAGGGSIPFEALRYGFQVISNELNPVAGAILEGTVVLPFTQGPELSEYIAKYGQRWAQNCAKRLNRFYPNTTAGQLLDYVWAHTVPCPTTGLPTPLCPNFWLDVAGKTAIALSVDTEVKRVQVRIVHGEEADVAGERSTYKRGAGISIWTNEPFDADYIREQAQGGMMGEMLLAIVYTTGKGRQFSPPSSEDVNAITEAKRELGARLPGWEVRDLVPTETRFVGPADRSAQYGLRTMRDLFSPRQLLTNVTALEELLNISKAAVDELGEERGKAVTLHLALAMDRIVDYNSRLASWESTYVKLAHTFDRHDFSFKWSFAEMEGANELISWAVSNAENNHRNICALLGRDATMFLNGAEQQSQVIIGTATQLPIASESVDAVITDPPYYDNVMYAECSDFFYVWLKRALRDTWPQFAASILTDKEHEVVANKALFKDLATHRGSGKRKAGAKTAEELSNEKYERLLTDSFREAHRVLKANGVMTVMFTHKRVDAWDTLGMALLESGFSIESSWPVHTESENSLHQAKKNSASSTILLTCRKRESIVHSYWTDIRHDVQRAAEHAVQRFSAQGIVGVDLTLATYGPALSVLSRNWPVYTGETSPNGSPQMIRPEVALDLARERVAALKKRGLLGGRQVDFDRQTDWWLLAWNDFKAREFPSGEALKLSIATHLDLSDLENRHGLLSTSGGTASILTPAQRRSARRLDPEAKSFATYVDALQALMLIYEAEGLTAARAWLKRLGYADDAKFHDLVSAALRAIPRTKVKDRFTVPEASILDSIRATMFETILAPVDDPAQLALVEA